MEMRGPVGGGVWCREMIVDEHGGRWRVDAWVAPRGTRLVLGELRVAPAIAGKADENPRPHIVGLPGEPWLLEPAKVPRFGLEKRLLDKVPVGRFVPQVLAGLSEAAVGLDAVGPGGFVPRGMWVTSHLLEAIPGLSAMARRPRQRRNVGRDDEFYARLAADYVAQIRASSRAPVKDIAERRGDTPAHIRDLLHEARERGLLTKGTAGKSEGALTSRAVALLKGRKPSRRRTRR